jgi:hypothetical protein
MTTFRLIGPEMSHRDSNPPAVRVAAREIAAPLFTGLEIEAKGLEIISVGANWVKSAAVGLPGEGAVQ